MDHYMAKADKKIKLRPAIIGDFGAKSLSETMQKMELELPLVLYTY